MLLHKACSNILQSILVRDIGAVTVDQFTRAYNVCHLPLCGRLPVLNDLEYLNEGWYSCPPALLGSKCSTSE